MIRPAGPTGPETVRPGLSRILLALERSGHPEEGFRTLHIAGTNGKGSTAALAEAVLRPIAGGPVGLYTSPHLVSPEERIRVDGKKIPAAVLEKGFRAAESLGDAADPLTYFEKMTWAACDWFRRRKASVVVMETGLGGRWDATSACRPAVSVITNVGYDHREWLGNTLARIAAEKAGILKEGVPLVIGRLRPSARAVVRRRAGELRCPAWELGRDFEWREERAGAVEVSLPGIRIGGLRLAMRGRHQKENAAVALAATWRWAGDRGVPADAWARAAARALASVRVPGRLAKLPCRRNARCWVDGGHNPDAARAVAREISVSPPWRYAERVVALWSMLKDKDMSGYLRELSPCIDGAVTYPLPHERGADAASLERACRRRKIPCRTAADFSGAWVVARRWAGPRGVVLVCGSLMTAGEAYRRRVGSVP
ncbi:MAG: folylpolyglutamate synthase/dihydrofolate synthase family protein [Thermodesulfobacteriota bacterium]